MTATPREEGLLAGEDSGMGRVGRHEARESFQRAVFVPFGVGDSCFASGPLVDVTHFSLIQSRNLLSSPVYTDHLITVSQS